MHRDRQRLLGMGGGGGLRSGFYCGQRGSTAAERSYHTAPVGYEAAVRDRDTASSQVHVDDEEAEIWQTGLRADTGVTMIAIVTTPFRSKWNHWKKAYYDKTERFSGKKTDYFNSKLTTFRNLLQMHNVHHSVWVSASPFMLSERALLYFRTEIQGRHNLDTLSFGGLVSQFLPVVFD